jgi:site-specific DNA recombinase
MQEQGTPIRAAVYSRVSTFLQRSRGYGLAVQDDDTDRHVARMGAAVVGRWSDTDSGADWDLPGLNAMLDAARRGEFDVLIVPEPDRFARSMAKQLVLEEELRRLGVQVHYARYPLDDTPEGRLLKNQLSSFAEYEREKIAFRTTRGRMKKAEMGFVVGSGPAPTGYRYVLNNYGKACGLQPDELWKPIIARIFLLAQRRSTPQIADILNADGVKAPRGGMWRGNVIRQIVRNRVYTGTAVYAGIETTVPALVTRAQFDAAQAALTQRYRGTRSARHTTHVDPYTLRGMLTCGFCGRNLVIAKAGPKGAPVRYYVCHHAKPFQAARAGVATCPLPNVNALALEAHTWGAVAATLLDDEWLRAGLDAHQRDYAEAVARREARVSEIETVIARERAQLRAIAAKHLAADPGGELEAIYLDAAKRCEARIAALEAEHASARSLASEGLSPDDVQSLQAFAAEVRAGLGYLGDGEKRRIYELMNLRGAVRTDPAGVRVGQRHRYVIDWQAVLPLRNSDGDSSLSMWAMRRANCSVNSASWSAGTA